MHKKMPIFYSALMLTGVNLLLRLVSTSFQVYISGRIGAAGVGLLQLVLTVGMMGLTAGMAGIRTATMYLTAEELGKKRLGSVRWVLSSCFTYSIVCSVVVSGLLYYFADLLAVRWIGDMGAAGAIRILAGFLPVNCLCGVMTGYFTAANRIGTLAAVEVGEQLLSMSFTMLMLNFWAGSDPTKACMAVVAGSGFSGCLTLTTLIYLRCRERVKSSDSIPLRSRLLKAAVPLALADDLKTGISTTENLMVPKRLSLFPGTENPLALFGIVCGMVFPVLMFPAAILFGLAELLIPELARCAAAGSKTRIEYLVKRSLRVSMLYGSLFCGLMYLMADELCLQLYNSSQAGTYLKVFSLLCPMLYCDAITDAMTKGLGQQTACVRYNIITSLIDVVLLYILLPWFGMRGYFVSFLITHALNFTLSLRRLLMISKCKVDWWVPIRTVMITFLSILLAGLVSNPILKCWVYLVSGGCMLFLMKVLSKEDILWIRGLATSIR